MNTPDTEMPLPLTECKWCGRKSEIVDMENCPFCEKKPTPDTEWSEALQVEVIEDYIHLAEMRHFAKDPVAHMEEMREHWQKLQDFITQLLTSRDTYWKERVRKNVLKYSNQKFLEGTIVDPLELYETITNEDNLK